MNLYTPSGLLRKVVAWYAEGCGVDSRPRLHRFAPTSGARGVLPCNGWGVTVSQLDILIPLSVADYGQLQLGVAYWATAVALLHAGPPPRSSNFPPEQ